MWLVAEKSPQFFFRKDFFLRKQATHLLRVRPFPQGKRGEGCQNCVCNLKKCILECALGKTKKGNKKNIWTQLKISKKEQYYKREREVNLKCGGIVFFVWVYLGWNVNFGLWKKKKIVDATDCGVVCCVC